MPGPEPAAAGLKLRTVQSELAFPARSLSCLLAFIVFALLLVLAARAGIFGIWLAIIVVPALFRFLVTIAAARSAGRDVDTPGIELFTLGGNAWTLFPVAWLVVLALLAVLLADDYPAAAYAVAIAGAALWPAMLGVLVITHSPLESLNPAALGRLIRHAGPGYAWLPAVLALTVAASRWAAEAAGALGDVVLLYGLFACHALIGAMLREASLIDAIDVAEDGTVRARADSARLARERQLTLNHAYALFSRGNRPGALAHLSEWLAGDPDPLEGRAWFQAQMLAWEGPLPALLFGADHLGWLLAAGERVRAVKLMLRLRLADPAFYPDAADVPAAIAAARACGNADLAAALSAESARRARAPEAPPGGL